MIRRAKIRTIYVMGPGRTSGEKQLTAFRNRIKYYLAAPDAGPGRYRMRVWIVRPLFKM
jgi:hypothetical protein